MTIARPMSVINRFFTAFASGDAAAMGACYADDARFRDPAFGDLDAKQVRAMWQMLLGRSKDLRITFTVLRADEHSGACEWHARYTFASTGRKVHNIIRSEFTLRNGLIVQQHDRFNFWRWSRQALGAVGWLLGWTPIVQGKVRRTARNALDKHLRQGA
ncbi:MAG: nuclear transport factor 2 family protein [Flavobacteriales bacterium]|nr:nuclear transport factor 2 family protein [Flavobacteriales bacterium]